MAAVIACERVTDPALSSATERFNPPVVYQKWWAQTEACSGLKGSFNSIDWYHTPERTIPLDGEDATAYWSRGSNRIVLTQYAELDGQVVRHEMLHALLKGKGGEHPRDQFLGKCRGVVHCEEKCVPSQSADSQFPFARRLPAESLTVNVTLSPATPSMSVDGGFFQVIVEVNNARSEQIVIKIPPPYPGFSPVAFTSSLVGVTVLNDVRFAKDYSSVAFGPGETKREIFDYSLAATQKQAAINGGVYRVYGKYGSLQRGPFTITLPSS